MAMMYMTKRDYSYFEVLYGSLDQEKRLKFLKLLKSAGSEQTGMEITQIRIIDDAPQDPQAIQPSEMITRTMIKKTYMAAKDGGK